MVPTRQLFLPDNGPPGSGSSSGWLVSAPQCLLKWGWQISVANELELGGETEVLERPKKAVKFTI